jgi:16S rRNA G966 N2-methylase RsmD
VDEQYSSSLLFGIPKQMTLSLEQIQSIAASPYIPPNGDPYSRIAKIHKYWSRKPWSVIDQLLDNYTKPDDVVLDPFCGSGVIGLQAIRAGRNFEGSDLNPFAIRLTRETINGEFNSYSFQLALEGLRLQVMDTINDLYKIDGDLVLYSIPSKSDLPGYNAVILKANSTKAVKTSVKLEDLPKVNFKAEDDPLLPDQYFPKKFYKDRFSYKGVEKVSQLFSERNLLALSRLYHAIDQLDAELKSHFELCLTNTLLHVSKLKSEKVRPLGVNNYWIPDDFIEENVWWRFEDRCKQFQIAKETITKALQTTSPQDRKEPNITIADATNLMHLPDNSVDYILTDPPYGDAIQYSELSLIWNCWIRQLYETENEIIINPEQSKDSQTYASMLEKFLIEASRVLKLDCPMTISFHSKDISLWCELAASLYACGFELENLFTSHGVGSPFTKNWASFSPKSDIYITIRNRRFKDRTTEVTPGLEFLQSLGEFANDNLDSGQQIYDFFVLASVNEIMKGFRLTGLHKKTMASIVERFQKLHE